MVHHIVMWSYQAHLSEQAKKEAGERIRQELLAVKEKVSGICSLEVITEGLPSSNKDLALIASFESAEALSAYQVHPEHVKAGSFLKSVTCDRVCMDYL